MNEIEKFEIKLDNPSAYHNMYILESYVLEDDITKEIFAKVEVRDGHFTKIRLEEIKPNNIIMGHTYYIISGDDNKYKKTYIMSTPIHDKETECLIFQGRIFGEQKPMSKGVVNFHIPLQLEQMSFYKLELMGAYNEGE